jgi:ubiquinone/menaquinone biosynthesis C-methylase UbiE
VKATIETIMPSAPDLHSMDGSMAEYFHPFFACECIKLSHILDSLRDKNGKLKILDIGTGYGILPQTLLSNVECRQCIDRIVGIDNSSEMIQKALLFKEKMNFSDLVEYKLMDGEDLKFPDETFDVVFSLMGINFFHNVVKGLSEAYRVLKKGGYIVICSWTKLFPASWIFECAEQSGMYQFSGARSKILTFADCGTLRKYLVDTGFKNIELSTVDHLWKGTKAEYLENMKVLTNAMLTHEPRKTEWFNETIHRILEPYVEQGEFLSLKVRANIAVAYKA